MNRLQLANMLRMGNPQQLVMSMLQQQAGNNLVASQALGLVQQGKYSELDKLARNLCQSAGLNYEKELADFRRSIGI